MRSILVVEDERKIAQLVRDYLAHAGFHVTVAYDGETALMAARRQPPDLVVLDLGLPGRDGLDVTRELRRFSAVPIVMLTARGDETDRVVGLEPGPTTTWSSPSAPKSWSPASARCCAARALLSNPRTMCGSATWRSTCRRRQVQVAGPPVELTATEFELLHVLAREPGRVFTRGQLLDAVHGVAFETYERAIDAHVKNIRKKIEPPHERPRYLLTVHGVGYRFAEA